MIDLDELEKLARAATPGPWSIGTSSPLCIKTDVGVVIARVQLDDNCDYIAAANPAVIIALVAELRRLRLVACSIRAVLKHGRTEIGDTMAQFREVLAEGDRLVEEYRAALAEALVVLRSEHANSYNPDADRTARLRLCIDAVEKLLG